jgi:hypothetical protein
VIERAPTEIAEELELSNVIPANAGEEAHNSRRRRTDTAATRLSGLTRRILLVGVNIFMMDSFSLTRNQEQFSASGKL